jgi:hypothetical protein
LNQHNLAHALLFKDLATLRIDILLFDDVEQLLWNGATPSFQLMTKTIGDERLAKRVKKLSNRLSNNL